MTDLEQLAERCEKASGANRELDSLIAPLLGLRVTDEGHPIGRTCYDSTGALHVLPRFTASLDAAMTLVPEGYDWAVFRTNGGLTVHAWCGSREDVFSSTPALALCAAALRAIAANRK